MGAAQFGTDLQWPWGSAQRRFTSWLAALEDASDDEARAAGVDGADLAAALIGSLQRLKYHVGRAWRRGPAPEIVAIKRRA